MRLSILTPEQTIFNGEVEYITVPGELGLMQILKDHAPILTGLGPGKVVYKTENVERSFIVTGGYLEFNRNQAVILADTEEKPSV